MLQTLVKVEQETEADQVKRAFVKVMVEVAQAIPKIPTLENISTFEASVEHLKVATNELNQWLEDDDLNWPFTSLGLFYKSRSLYYDAESYYEQCLILTQQRLGQEHISIATTFKNLAEIYKDQGKYDEAELRLMRSLSISEKQLGIDHPDVAQIFNNLALIYKLQGKYRKAERLYRRAISISEKQLGKNHISVAGILPNLAEVYKDQGKYGKTLRLYKRCVSIQKKHNSQSLPQEEKQWLEHPLNIAFGLNNEADLYYRQGKYGQAESMFRQSLSIRERELGKNHPDVAISLNNLAGVCQNNYEAEPLYLRALLIWEKTLGVNHPQVATTLGNLATLYFSQGRGRYTEAETLHLRALSIAEDSLGKNHPKTKRLRNSLRRNLRRSRKLFFPTLWQWRINMLYELIVYGTFHIRYDLEQFLGVILFNLPFIFFILLIPPYIIRRLPSTSWVPHFILCILSSPLRILLFILCILPFMWLLKLIRWLLRIIFNKDYLDHFLSENINSYWYKPS